MCAMKVTDIIDRVGVGECCIYSVVSTDYFFRLLQRAVLNTIDDCELPQLLLSVATSFQVTRFYRASAH